MTDTYDPSTTLRTSMDTFVKPIQNTGTTPNPYRFGAAWGYITDPNGFLQLGARYLWPEVGRFVSQDPIPSNRLRLVNTCKGIRHAERFDGRVPASGFKGYYYVENNPLRWLDPRGEASWSFSTTCCGVKCRLGPPWFWFLYAAQQDCRNFCFNYPTESEDFWHCVDACETIFPGGGGSAHGIKIKCSRKRNKGCWTFKCESSTMP